MPTNSTEEEKKKPTVSDYFLREPWGYNKKKLWVFFFKFLIKIE